MDKILYVRIDASEKKKLEAHAKKLMKETGISPITMSTVVRQFIQEGLKRGVTGGDVPGHRSGADRRHCADRR